MHGRLFSFLIFILVPCSALTKESNYQIIVEFDSYNYSQPTSIDSFINKFNGDLQDGDHAVSTSLLSIGATYENFSLSVVKRLDYFYKFSNDTARFYYQTENDVDFIEEETYQLDLQISHLEAIGLQVGYQWQLPSNVTLGIASSYLNTTDFYQGKLVGDAIWQGIDDFQIDAPTKIYSAHNELLTYPEAEAKGEGITIDVMVDWQINQQWKVALSAKDAFSRIYWRNALFSQINRWQVYRLTENGELDTTPILEGRVLDYQQKLPEKWLGRISYSTENNTHYFSQVFHTRYFSHYQLGINKPINDKHSVSLAWHFQAQAIELGYVMPYGYIRLMTDSLDRKQIHAFTLNIGLAIPF